MGKLDGKVAVVTGGGSGIGPAAGPNLAGGRGGSAKGGERGR